MKWPEFPERKQPLDIDDSFIEIIHSIAKEEDALSFLINSEAKKVHAFVGEKCNFPTCPSNNEIIIFCQSINRIVDSILMKEWLLLRKFETVLQAKEKIEHHKGDHDCCCEHHITKANRQCTCACHQHKPCHNKNCKCCCHRKHKENEHY